jgi:hypothetical protein
MEEAVLMKGKFVGELRSTFPRRERVGLTKKAI